MPQPANLESQLATLRSVARHCHDCSGSNIDASVVQGAIVLLEEIKSFRQAFLDRAQDPTDDAYVTDLSDKLIRLLGLPRAA
jgi:hypothetical protein